MSTFKDVRLIQFSLELISITLIILLVKTRLQVYHLIEIRHQEYVIIPVRGDKVVYIIICFFNIR